MAETGSGKTAAFLLPMLVHIMDQPELREGEGPIAVIMAPTRELAEQIHREARRFAKGYGLRVCAAFGGLEKRTQVKDLKAGSEVRSPVNLTYQRMRTNHDASIGKLRGDISMCPRLKAEPSK